MGPDVPVVDERMEVFVSVAPLSGTDVEQMHSPLVSLLVGESLLAVSCDIPQVSFLSGESDLGSTCHSPGGSGASCPSCLVTAVECSTFLSELAGEGGVCSGGSDHLAGYLAGSSHAVKGGFKTSVVCSELSSECFHPPAVVYDLVVCCLESMHLSNVCPQFCGNILVISKRSGGLKTNFLMIVKCFELSHL